MKHSLSRLILILLSAQKGLIVQVSKMWYLFTDSEISERKRSIFQFNVNVSLRLDESKLLKEYPVVIIVF